MRELDGWMDGVGRNKKKKELELGSNLRGFESDRVMAHLLSATADPV